MLHDYRFASRDAEAVFACLSGGVEKLLKLTMGVISLDEGQPWQSKATMRRAGHRIVDLDDSVRALIAERVDHSSAPGLIRRLLEVTDGHTGIVQVLATLERYADSGRFHNLNVLAGSEQPDQSPKELWDELEMDIVEANPDMLEQLAGPEHDHARTDMNALIASSLSLWCELVARAWITGSCGRVAKQWSPQLDLGHQPPDCSPAWSRSPRG
jgi:hypothetical protein